MRYSVSAQNRRTYPSAVYRPDQKNVSQHYVYSTLCIIIEDNYFIIKQNNYERLRISKDDITYVDHYQDNSMILTLKTRKKILIHLRIENYSGLITELKQFCCFIEMPKKRNTLKD
jgi:hypothetical protein